MLSRVVFENVKVLQRVDLDLRRLTVLVGPNGCGKTTTLQQIELMSRMTTLNGNSDVLSGVGVALKAAFGADVDRPRGRAAAPSAWRGVVGERVLRVTIPAIQVDAPWFQRTKIEIDGASWDWPALTRSGGTARSDLDAGLAQVRFSAQRLQLIPSVIAAPSPVTADAIGPGGEGLPSVLKNLASNDPPAYQALWEDMRRVVPAFRGLKLPTRPGQGKSSDVHLEIHYANGVTIPAAQASDGTLIALALLTAVYDRDLAPLVLLDDLDHGLHLTAQFEVISLLRRLLAARDDLQIVATTHSPYLLDAFTPDEVYVMALDADGFGHARRLDEMPDFELAKRGLQTGEIWASVGEAWVLGA